MTHQEFNERVTRREDEEFQSKLQKLQKDKQFQKQRKKRLEEQKQLAAEIEKQEKAQQEESLLLEEGAVKKKKQRKVMATFWPWKRKSPKPPTFKNPIPLAEANEGEDAAEAFQSTIGVLANYSHRPVARDDRGETVSQHSQGEEASALGSPSLSRQTSGTVISSNSVQLEVGDNDVFAGPASPQSESAHSSPWNPFVSRQGSLSERAPSTRRASKVSINAVHDDNGYMAIRGRGPEGRTPEPGAEEAPESPGYRELPQLPRDNASYLEVVGAAETESLLEKLKRLRREIARTIQTEKSKADPKESRLFFEETAPYSYERKIHKKRGMLEFVGAKKGMRPDKRLMVNLNNAITSIENMPYIAIKKRAHQAILMGIKNKIEAIKENYSVYETTDRDKNLTQFIDTLEAIHENVATAAYENSLVIPRGTTIVNGGEPVQTERVFDTVIAKERDFQTLDCEVSLHGSTTHPYQFHTAEHGYARATTQTVPELSLAELNSVLKTPKQPDQSLVDYMRPIISMAEMVKHCHPDRPLYIQSAPNATWVKAVKLYALAQQYEVIDDTKFVNDENTQVSKKEMHQFRKFLEHNRLLTHNYKQAKHIAAKFVPEAIPQKRRFGKEK